MTGIPHTPHGAAFAFGGTAPYSGHWIDFDRPVETLLQHGAAAADRLRLTYLHQRRTAVSVSYGEEQIRVFPRQPAISRQFTEDLLVDHVKRPQGPLPGYYRRKCMAVFPPGETEWSVKL